MFKRLSIALLILVALTACSVLSQTQPAPTVVPTTIALSNTATPVGTPIALPATPSTTPTIEPTPTPAPDLPAIWVLDGAMSRLVAVDPQTGKVLNQIAREFALGLTSANGRWRFGLVNRLQENRWNVALSILDLTRSASPQLVPLVSDLSIPIRSTRTMPTAHLQLSRDERKLFFMQVQRVDEQWVTHVYVVDVARPERATVIQEFQVFASDATQEPVSIGSVLSADDRRLWIVQDLQRKPPASQNDMSPWFTRVAILNLNQGKVERVIEVPGDVQAHGFWSSSILSPDERMLYLLQQIVRASNLAGYRFVAFDTQTLQIVNTRLIETTNLDEQFSTYPLGLRLTPDGHYLIGYLGASVPNRTGYFEFMDTQNGLIAQTVSVPRKVQPSTAFNISYIVASVDNKLVYFADALTKEVFVLDLAQRKVVRQAIVSGVRRPTSLSPFGDWLGAIGNWFISTAYAKFYPQPGAILSPDGQRFYFVDVQGEDKGDGVWGVETATLKPMGHWLSSKDIYGIQLGADGRELYAASPNDYTLYVLDAQTGAPRRALKQEQTVFKPMGFITVQN